MGPSGLIIFVSQVDRFQQLRQLGDFGGDAPGLVINLSVHLLIPVPISPREMEGIEPFVRWGATPAPIAPIKPSPFPD